MIRLSKGEVEVEEKREDRRKGEGVEGAESK